MFNWLSRKKNPWFVEFANFNGFSVPTKADFNVPI